MTSTLPPLVQAVSGAFGSAAANALVYPLDLVATRLQTTSSKRLRGFAGVLRALRHVLETEGWSGLYDGLPTDTAATITSNFLYFYFYAFLRTILVRRKTRLAPATVKGAKGAAPILLSVAEELGIGFVAGVASRAISTPLSVITVRLQMEAEGEDDRGEMDPEKGDRGDAERRGEPRGVASTVRRIYEEQGLGGFWGGFSTTIPLSLNPAITMFLFQLYGKLITRKGASALGTPSASSSFLGAALSNAVATWFLYPLMLAKTRLQIHRRRMREAADEGQEKFPEASMLTIWEDAMRKEGPSGLYQGLEAQLIKGFVSQGVTMMIKQRVETYIVALYMLRLRQKST